MSSKRQQTMAKRARELKVKQRRALKLEKKHAAALARKAEDEATPFGLASTPAGPAD
jgi:ribosomal protein L9